MKILANENIPLPAVEALRRAGHDVLWARTAMPGAPDPRVLARAAAEGRLVLTFDKDFGELVCREGGRGLLGVVLLRTRRPSARAVAADVVRVLGSRDDWAGDLPVVQTNRVRMSRLPQQA